MGDDHITLEKATAFNTGYRENWRDYLDQYSSSAIREKLSKLTSGMDSLSNEICKHQLNLIPYFFPHVLLNLVEASKGLEKKLLPPEIAEDLKRIGFFGKEQRFQQKYKQALELPELPLPEIIAHSGLIYIRDFAKARIHKRVVIDAGAYIGDTAKLFQKVYGAGRVFAIEPDEINYQQMKSLCAKWGLVKQIVPIQAATGRAEGTMKLWGQGVGTSAIRKAGLADMDSKETPIITVDGLVAKHALNNVALLKLDVEGSEYDTILGARNTISEQRPILLISIYHTAKDFFEIKPLLEEWSLGYKFMVRKLSTDLIKEFILIGVPDS